MSGKCVPLQLMLSDASVQMCAKALQQCTQLRLPAGRKRAPSQNHRR